MLLAVFVLAALAVPEAPDPATVVERLYRAHFAASQRWDLTLKQHRDEFTPALLALLDADARAAAANPDEVVGLDFDPLTDAQEAADGYAVGKARVEGGTAAVPVEIRVGGERTALTVHLERQTGRWRVSNVASREADLVSTLKQLAAGRAKGRGQD